VALVVVNAEFSAVLAGAAVAAAGGGVGCGGGGGAAGCGEQDASANVETKTTDRATRADITPQAIRACHCPGCRLQAPSARTSQKHGPRGNSTRGASFTLPDRSSTTIEPPTQWA